MYSPHDTGYVYVSNLAFYLAKIDAFSTFLCILLTGLWTALRRYCNSTSVDRSARVRPKRSLVGGFTWHSKLEGEEGVSPR